MKPQTTMIDLNSTGHSFTVKLPSFNGLSVVTCDYCGYIIYLYPDEIKNMRVNFSNLVPHCGEKCLENIL